MTIAEKQIRALLDGCHSLFLCFTSDGALKLDDLLIGLAIRRKQVVRVTTVRVPPGVLWNDEPCTVLAIAKGVLPRSALFTALGQQLGDRRPSQYPDVFTLGVLPEDAEALDQVGLFGCESRR